jgi:hypothetical protein
MRVIVRASLVARTLHDLNITVKHRGRDNIGGVVTTRDCPDWDESEADCLYHSVIVQAGLELEPPPDSVLEREKLLKILCEWADRDHHAKFDAKCSNSRISARLMPSQTTAVRLNGRRQCRIEWVGH